MEALNQLNRVSKVREIVREIGVDTARWAI